MYTPHATYTLMYTPHTTYTESKIKQSFRKRLYHQSQVARDLLDLLAEIRPWVPELWKEEEGEEQGRWAEGEEDEEEKKKGDRKEKEREGGRRKKGRGRKRKMGRGRKRWATSKISSQISVEV